LQNDRPAACADLLLPSTITNTQPPSRLEYATEQPIDGVMPALLVKLQPVLGYDHLRVSRQGGLTRAIYVTVFRRQAKRLFHVKLLRKSGRWIVRMGGGDPGRALAAINVCRDHFDAWFGVAGNHDHRQR